MTTDHLKAGVDPSSKIPFIFACDNGQFITLQLRWILFAARKLCIIHDRVKWAGYVARMGDRKGVNFIRKTEGENTEESSRRGKDNIKKNLKIRRDGVH
jgi:hypothetical protein